MTVLGNNIAIVDIVEYNRLRDERTEMEKTIIECAVMLNESVCHKTIKLKGLPPQNEFCNDLLKAVYAVIDERNTKHKLRELTPN